MLQKKRKFREFKRQNQRRLFWQRSTRSLVLVALLFVLSMAVPPVLAQVSVSTQIVQTQSDAPSLVKQGKQLYHSGQFEEAAQVWQQAADAFAAQGNSLNRAMALSNLSLTYQQLGDWEKAKEAIANSLDILQTLEKTQEQQRILAQTLDIQGQLQQKIGRSQVALETWKQAADIYADIGDQNGEAISQINRALAMQDLGLYPRACQTLLKALDLDEQECQISDKQIETLKQELLESPPNELREARARGLRSLGNVLRVIGNLKQSQQVLLSSLEVAQSWNSPQEESKAWLNLGNTELALAKRAEELENTKQANTYTKNALANYQQAATVASPTLKLQAQLNQLDLLVEKERWQEAKELSLSIHELLAQFPLTRTAIYAKITLARNLACLNQKNPTCLKPKELQARSSSSPLDEPSYLEVTQLLETAARDAQKLEDKRSQSYAVGILGRLYENLPERGKAQEYTEQALTLAWQSQASELTYQWQWQLGRLLKAGRKNEAAIAAYRQAVETLKSLRNDLVAINPEIQFTFRESVEPVYREYVELLLRSEGVAQPSQENLKQAREAIDSLQLAELENFFRLVCLDAQPVVLDQVTDKDDPTAAVIYPILLEDRFEIILKLPQQDLRHYTTPIEDQKEVERILGRLVQSLEQRNSQETLPFAQQVYDWLLRPAEADLARSQVKTLVFVLDSALRNVPMAVLHDRQHYLIEKYGIALTPGLQLLDPQPLLRGELKALTAGLTEARGDFPALRYVDDELAQVQLQVPSVGLLDRQFTNTAFQNQIEALPFPVVHLATHGQFSSQAEETFILTWDDRIDVNQLNNLLRSNDPNRTGSIELLVLSACETLTGDKRAALGLAGVAIRAGARSTLATLWRVNDEATAFLMGQFYEALKEPTVTKAEALRRAQLTLLKNPRFARPHFWAPYVLVGNWL